MIILGYRIYSIPINMISVNNDLSQKLWIYDFKVQMWRSIKPLHKLYDGIYMFKYASDIGGKKTFISCKNSYRMSYMRYTNINYMNNERYWRMSLRPGSRIIYSRIVDGDDDLYEMHNARVLYVNEDFSDVLHCIYFNEKKNRMVMLHRDDIRISKR